MPTLQVRLYCPSQFFGHANRALGACPVLQGPAATPSLVLLDLSLATKWRAPSWRPRLSTSLVPTEEEQRSQFWEFPVGSMSS